MSTPYLIRYNIENESYTQWHAYNGYPRDIVELVKDLFKFYKENGTESTIKYLQSLVDGEHTIDDADKTNEMYYENSFICTIESNSESDVYITFQGKVKSITLSLEKILEFESQGIEQTNTLYEALSVSDEMFQEIADDFLNSKDNVDNKYLKIISDFYNSGIVDENDIPSGIIVEPDDKAEAIIFINNKNRVTITRKFVDNLSILEKKFIVKKMQFLLFDPSYFMTDEGKKDIMLLVEYNSIINWIVFNPKRIK